MPRNNSYARKEARRAAAESRTEGLTPEERLLYAIFGKPAPVTRTDWEPIIEDRLQRRSW